MKLGWLNHIGVATQPKPLPGGEGLGWGCGFGAAFRTRRRTPTPLRLGGKLPSLTAPPLKGRVIGGTP